MANGQTDDRQPQSKRQEDLYARKEGLNGRVASGRRKSNAPATGEQHERGRPSRAKQLSRSLLGRRSALPTDDDAVWRDAHVPPASRAGVMRAEEGQGVAVDIRGSHEAACAAVKKALDDYGLLAYPRPLGTAPEEMPEPFRSRIFFLLLRLPPASHSLRASTLRISYNLGMVPIAASRVALRCRRPVLIRHKVSPLARSKEAWVRGRKLP